MNPRSEETAYLKRLINDFPAKTKPKEASQALRTIAIRYQVLESEELMRGASLAILKKEGIIEDFSAAMKKRAFFMHRFLF